jgi:homoserine dehydrogenase
MRSIAIGLLGAGNVGCGVLRLLHDNADAIAARIGAKVVVKHVLLRHDGRLDIDSQLGLGSTFSAWLPRARLVAPAVERGVAQAA